jgi:hypothetical protein
MLLITDRGPNKMNQNWRDLIGGMFLVPALHLGFLLLILLMQSIFMSRALGLIFLVFFQSMGIAQFVYLIPVGLVYWRRRRFEVIKGITIGAILTILVNAACFLRLI